MFVFYVHQSWIYLINNYVNNNVKKKSNLKSAWNQYWLYFVLFAHIAIFVVNNSFMQVNPHKKNVFVIFNPNLKMLNPSKMMGLLWWYQLDGLGMRVTSWTTPPKCQCLLQYFTTSNQFAVEKQAMPSIFLIQYSVSLGCKNGRKLPVHADFKVTLYNLNICFLNVQHLFMWRCF